MKCPECGADIKAGQKFCGKCGAPFTVRNNEQYDPGLARSRGINTKEPVNKGYAPGLERRRRNQQSQQPHKPLSESDIKVNQTREKSSQLPVSFLWIGSTILTGIIIQSLTSSFNFVIFSWGMFFIFPVGAMATAYLNVCIFNLFRKIFRIKPQGNVFLNATLGTIIIILMLANSDPAQTVISMRYRSSVSSGIDLPPFLGWALRIRDIFGFWLIAMSCYNDPGKIFED